MSSNFDRPTAVRNTLDAVNATHPFEEEHPGPELLKYENTARNRINREHKRDKMRNRWLQRLYDGSFFIAWHVFDALSRFSLPSFRTPIRPYNGGELNAGAIAKLLVEVSCALCTIHNGVFDALCAVCESPLEPPEPQEPQAEPMQAPLAPSLAPIGPPIVQIANS